MKLTKVYLAVPNIFTDTRKTRTIRILTTPNDNKNNEHYQNNRRYRCRSVFSEYCEDRGRKVTLFLHYDDRLYRKYPRLAKTSANPVKQSFAIPISTVPSFTRFFRFTGFARFNQRTGKTDEKLTRLGIESRECLALYRLVCPTASRYYRSATLLIKRDPSCQPRSILFFALNEYYSLVAEPRLQEDVLRNSGCKVREQISP